MNEILKNAPEGTKIVLVGNKSDMASKRMVDGKEAQAFAQKNNLTYIETSAKEGTGVFDAFKTLAESCYKVALEQGPPPNPSGGSGIPVGGGGSNTGQGCTC